MTSRPEPNEVDRLTEVLEASDLDSFVENMQAADAAVRGPETLAGYFDRTKVQHKPALRKLGHHADKEQTTP